MMREFTTQNRKNLSAQLDKGAIAVINSNDVMPTNADGTMRFRQNNDLYWLTGINQEDTTLLLFPEHPDKSRREILFVKQVDEQFVKWHGRRLSMQQARDVSGIETVMWYSDFESVFYTTVVYADSIYLNSIEHPRSENRVETNDDRFTDWCKKKFKLHTYKRLAPILGRLRTVKASYEISQLQKACDISGLGFKRVLGFVKPGVNEKRIEAEMIHEYLQHDGNWAGYEPIVASGQNTCILHYIFNNNTCNDGDLLLIDAAASYNLYNADLTRTIPVNGRYTKRQKQVYDAVLHVHKAIKQYARAGLYLRDIQEYTNGLLIEALAGLNLFTAADLKEKGAAWFLNRYCYHNFGHLLGLDVHDVGNNYEALPVNAVITVEPGIYIWEEQTGVRIENNVQLTATGTIDLMAGIPVETEEIEELMNSLS